MKRTIAFILATVLLVIGSTVMMNAVKASSIEYKFTGEYAGSPGYAEGELRFHAGTSGVYYLYFADKTAALKDYFAITSFDLKEGETGKYSMGERSAIPSGAVYVIASKESSPEKATVASAAASYKIPESKLFSSFAGNKVYSFAAYSDIHIDQQDGSKNIYYTNATDNFAIALERAKMENLDFIVSAGDQVTNASGNTLEWLEYQRVLSESSYDNPIYEALGNHETRYAKYSNCDVKCGIEEFVTATGLDDNVTTINRGKAYYEVTEPKSGDHFIFMALEGGVSSNEVDEFTIAQMNWVEELLEEYSGDGHRIFLIQHAPIEGYGCGDDINDPGYGGSLHLVDDNGNPFTNNQRFKRLIEKYRDVIWLSGHTHVDFRDDVNFSDENGKSCYMFHVPSVANTTRLSYTSKGKRTLDRTFYEDTTQGYFVDVYQNAAVLRGENLFYGKAYPQYSYIIGGEKNSVAPTTTTDNTTPTSNTDNTGNTSSTDPTDPTQIEEIKLGDVDLDGVVNIIDATYIQRHLARTITLNERQIKAAMLDGSGNINIVDATLIQQKLAKIIDKFPVEKAGTGIASTGASTVEANKYLNAYYQYASYVEYQELKKAKNTGKGIDAALSAFKTLLDKVCVNTVYFTDTEKMGNVHAYFYNSQSGKYIESWPGQKPTWVKKNNAGKEVYAVTVNTAKYDRVVFSNGSDKKTEDIVLGKNSGIGYYAVTDTSPMEVASETVNKMWYIDPEETATIYFTNTNNWSVVRVYYWNSSGNNGWPGKIMTYLRLSSSGKKIYKAQIPADASVIFTDGTNQTMDIPAVIDGMGYYLRSEYNETTWYTGMYEYTD